MSEIDILKDYKTQLLLFFDELIEQFPNESSLVLARLFIANNINIKDAMDQFIFNLDKNNSAMRKSIKERNNKFFSENKMGSVFNMQSEHTEHLKKLWLSDRLDDDDKIAIWNWIDIFVHYADRYVAVKNN